MQLNNKKDFFNYHIKINKMFLLILWIFFHVKIRFFFNDNFLQNWIET